MWGRHWAVGDASLARGSAVGVGRRELERGWLRRGHVCKIDDKADVRQYAVDGATAWPEGPMALVDAILP